MARDGVGSTDVLPTSVTLPPLDIGVRTIQLSPYRAGVAGLCPTRLPTSPAFPPCSCPLSFQIQVRRVASKSFALNFGPLRGQFTPCVPWRTVSEHSAPQCCDACHACQAGSGLPTPALAWEIRFWRRKTWRWTFFQAMPFLAAIRDWPCVLARRLRLTALPDHNTGPTSAYPGHYPGPWLLRASASPAASGWHLLREATYLTEGYRGVTPFPVSIARIFRAVLSTGFLGSAAGQV
jgi:hypothetical protein